MGDLMAAIVALFFVVLAVIAWLIVFPGRWIRPCINHRALEETKERLERLRSQARV